MTKTIINICGPARSGTTMLDLMLGNGENVFSCGEVYAWYRPWRKNHFSISCSCGSDPCPVWSHLKRVPEHLFHVVALEQSHADFIIDSSKELCWVIDNQFWGKENNLRVINFLIWKSPEDLAFSHWKRGECLMFWRQQFVEYYNDFFSAGLPFFAVSFDALVEDPQGVLQKICQLVGLGYFEGKEEFWNRQHHHLFGSLGTRKQVEAGGSRIGSTVYTDEFKKHLDEINRLVSQDREVQEIISKLKAADVSRTGPAECGNLTSSRLRPWWYYPRRMKQLVYRFLPKPAPKAS